MARSHAEASQVWSASAGLMALVGITSVALVFWPTTRGLVEIWLDSDRPYSHGLLVGPIALWLMVRACSAASLKAEPSALAVVLFACAALLWILAYSIDVLTLQQALLPMLMVLGAASVSGWAMARRLWFPAAFIYFAIPLWSALTPVLQSMTVYVVSAVLDVFGIPVFVEGNLISIPEGIFEVAGGCAGLHFFVVALTVASLRGYLTLDGWGARLALLAVAVSLACVTNWVRVGSLVAIGHFTDMQHYLIAEDHYYYGWGLFAVALIPFFLFAQRQLNRAAEHIAVREMPPPPSTLPRGRRAADVVVLCVFATLLVTPLLVTVPDGEVGVRLSFELPGGADGWQLAEPRDWRPVYAGADGEALGSYERDGRRVDVYLAVYRSQSQGREVVGNDNRLFGAGWHQQSAGLVEVQGIDGVTEIQERVIAPPRGRPRLVWLWYALSDRRVAQDVTVKLFQGLGSLMGRDSGAVIALSVACPDDCSEVRELLRDFVGSMGQPLSQVAESQQRDSAR